MLRTSPGGTASMPFREKGLNERVFSQSVPLSRPAPVQTGAKVRGFSPTGLEFTAETDSLLEGDGFEPSVPRHGELMKFALTPCRSEQDSNFRSPATVSSVGAL